MLRERLTRSDWLFIAACVLLVGGSLFVVLKWFSRAFPEAALDLKGIRNVKPEQVYLAVHRIDFSVYFKRLDTPTFAVLQSFERDATITEALEAGFKQAGTTEDEYAAQVQTWFAEWAQWGWFARPEVHVKTPHTQGAKP